MVPAASSSTPSDARSSAPSSTPCRAVRLSLSLGLALGALMLASPRAEAVGFAFAEIGYDNALLSNFNLVTLGNYSTSSSSSPYVYTDGRAIIGGNATSTGAGAAFCSNTTLCGGNAPVAVDASKQLYGAATVFGNVAYTGQYFAAGYGVTGSNMYIGGNASGGIYAGNKTDIYLKGTSNGLSVNAADNIRTSQSAFNGTLVGNTRTGTTQAGLSAASVFPFQNGLIASEVKNLANGLAALPGSKGVTAQALPANNGIFFTANADYVNAGKKYGVVTTTLADLAGQQNFQGINNNGNDATFVIVTGDGAGYTLPNLNSYAGSNKVIFDFVDAKVLNFGGNWSGSILAPLATVTMGGTMDGSVIVNQINQTQALYATNLFTGDLSGLVPEPASFAVMGAGLAALGLIRRRRRK